MLHPWDTGTEQTCEYQQSNIWHTGQVCGSQSTRCTTSKFISKQVAHHLITRVVALTSCPAAGREVTSLPAPCSGTVCLSTGKKE